MTSNFSNGQISSGGAPPATKPPEYVEGYIDMEHLVDIHMILSQSAKSDDDALATWIKQNYLQEPVSEIGRLIRDAEGYANLDKAYRRVRHLTGKAKDEWPFFDRTWKKLSATVVKNAIQGITAVSTIRSDSDGQPLDTPTSNGIVDQHDRTSQATQSQVTSNAKESDGHHAQERVSPQPNDHSPVVQNAIESRAHSQDPSHTSEMDRVPMDAAQKSGTGANILDITINGASSAVDALRDAGAGKVRGPHGRYVNKSEDISPAAKKGSRIKYIRKSKTRAALEGESEEEDTFSDEGMKAHNTLFEIASAVGEAEPSQSGSELSQEPLSIKATTNDLTAPVSAILAADAEAIPSNLDRFPPGLTQKKRKSDLNFERGGLKRARGSRGGVLGRPRKSETSAEEPKLASQKSLEIEQTTVPPKIEAETSVETTPKTTARRSSRKSAASALETSTPWDPAADVLFNGTGYKQMTKYNEPNGSTATSEGDLQFTGFSPGFDHKVDGTGRATTNGVSSATPSRAPSSKAPKPKIAPNSAKQKKRVSFSPGAQTDDVQFFARITTSSGTKDVLLSEEDLKSEVELVKRYAAWQQAGHADTSFEVFKNIAHFTR